MKSQTGRTTLPIIGSWYILDMQLLFAGLQNSRIWFRPRILRNVTKVDWSTTILGHRSSMPVYIVRDSFDLPDINDIHFSKTATALGKLGHPDGELNLTRAAAKHGVIQMVRTTLQGECLWFNNNTDTYPCILLFRRNCRCSATKPSPILPTVGFVCLWTYLFSWQVYRYVNKDRDITKRIVQHAERRGVKGLFITVDAPQLGRREKARVFSSTICR